MENPILTGALILISCFLALALLVITFILFIKKKITENQIEHLEQLRKKELQHLSELITIQETERERIACNIHDQIHPLMYSLRLNLENHLGVGDEQKSIIALCDNIQDDLSKITDKLAPRVLYKNGLIKALKIFITESMYIPSQFHSDIDSSYPFKQDSSLEVYRILLELICNLYKHEKITEIRFYITADSDTFRFRIEHDKPGISKTEFQMLLNSSVGLGLKSIFVRTTILEAELNFMRSHQSSIELKVKKQKLTAYPPKKSFA